MHNGYLLAIILSTLFWLNLASILYTYFGYPLLISFMPKKRRNLPETEKPFTPYVTLLIAAYNEEIVIEEKIKNSLQIEYPKEKLQILITADGSNDNTPAIVEQYADQGVELLYKPERRGKMAAINRAIPHAQGEILVFSDANNHYQPDTIQKLVMPFSDPQVAATSGAKVIDKEGSGAVGSSEGLYWKYESHIKKQESRIDSCTSVAGEILAVRKSAYIPPPDNIVNDDFFIAMQVLRQGYRLVYVPEARSSERASPSARDEVIRRTRINAGRYQAIAMARHILPLNRPLLTWQVISHKFLRPIVPFNMIAVLLINTIAVSIPYNRPDNWLHLSNPFGVIFLGLQAVFYLLAAIGMSAGGGKPAGKISRILYLPAFLTNSNYAALKGFFQFMRGKQLHMWERVQRQ
ncbi:MAG TPA: glycosyltransferase family 2 protein [Anaerolineales bacterium]|nr:glycosyltransferase family 2 protein [Anaerolineales bacterium]